MIGGIADTHTALWYLYADPRLSAAARTFIEAETAVDREVGASSITLAEIVYLQEKGRIPASSFDDLLQLMNLPAAALVHVPFDQEVAQTMRRVSRADVPDMPDRIIAATALHLGVPLISRDGRIRLSSVRTIW